MDAGQRVTLAEDVWHGMTHPAGTEGSVVFVHGDSTVQIMTDSGYRIDVWPHEIF